MKHYLNDPAIAIPLTASMSSKTISPPRRAARACARCQKRKKRCDLKFPTCTSCEKSGASCQGYDAQVGKDMPRSLVECLEERVAQLETRVRSMPRQTNHKADNSLARRLAQATLAIGQPISDSFFDELTHSALCFAPSTAPLVVLRQRRQECETDNDQNSLQHCIPPRISGLSGPTIELREIPPLALAAMLRFYLSNLTHHYPIIERPMLEHIYKVIREPDTGIHLSHFESYVMHIILAISSVALAQITNQQARALSLSFFSSALQHLRRMSDTQGVERLQAILLLAHYAHVNPEIVSVWTCVATAVKVAFDLGLPYPPEDGLIREVRETAVRYKLFGIVYDLDRSLAAMLRLPFSFSEDLGPQPPAGFERSERPSCTRHIRHYRHMEVEAHRVLHLLEDVPVLQKVGMTRWQLNLEARLDEWYALSEFVVPEGSLTFRHTMYYYMKTKLYRPTPRLPKRTLEERQTCFDTCKQIISSVEALSKANTLIYTWQTVHILFGAAVLLLDISWELRDWFPMRQSVIHVLTTVIPSCLDLLQTIGVLWKCSSSCVAHIKQMLDEVIKPYNIDIMAYELPNLIEEMATTEKLKALVFADRTPLDDTTHQVVSSDFELPDFESLPFDWELENLDFAWDMQDTMSI